MSKRALNLSVKPPPTKVPKTSSKPPHKDAPQSVELQAALKALGIQALRPGQADAITAVQTKMDALILIPTGESICVRVG